LKSAGVGIISAGLAGCGNQHWFKSQTRKPKKRPNILFAIADDWSWPHASIVGAKVVKTPTFDKVARDGVLFTNAFVSAPSCTPSRGAITTGQWHWRLEEGANLFSTLSAKFPVYPDILEQAGYHVGYMKKGWSPGSIKPGRTRNAAGPRHRSFAKFIEARPEGKPFCFWFGSSDPHRTYKWQSGVKSGMKLEDVEIPHPLPDSEIVRTDICDYFWEVQRFDTQTGEIIKQIEEMGELDNTLVIITSDNGMPFPRCKQNLYDWGTHVPLAACWLGEIKGGREVVDFISLTDLAPTFLEATGCDIPEQMTGRSFMNILTSRKAGRVDPKRDKVLTGLERHVICRKSGGGYPARAIRTHEFLYIRNFKPERWPAGEPEVKPGYWPAVPYGDMDASPTKTYIMDHRDEPEVKRLFELGFNKRPAEELYDLRKDPGQQNNVAADAKYAKTKAKLSATLMAELTASKDPRVLGGGDAFDRYPWRD